MEQWIPDDGLVEKVRCVGCSIKNLSNEDRTWVVVNLSALGWTAQEIADRLDCSLRLIRNIKAEPAAALATYILTLRHQLLNVSGTCRLELTILAQQVGCLSIEVTQLRHQRDALIDQLRLERTERPAVNQARRTSTPRRSTA
jgi:hypothetical protein